ncbi:MAG: hypothetical protein AAGG08_19320 [Actinomycetota bacterium]
MTALKRPRSSGRRVLALVAVGAVGLVACGSDSAGESGDSVLPPASEPALDADGRDDPADGGQDGDRDGATNGVDDRFTLPPDGAVIEVGSYGGFTIREIAFQSAPSLLVTADGRLIRPAAIAEVFPGPLLPQHTVASLSDGTSEALVAAVADMGLLDTADYTSESEVQIADAPTATLVITTTDGQVRHEAYALGFSGFGDEPETTPARQRLSDAITALGDPASLVGADRIGPEELWFPDAFQVVAMPLDDLGGFDPAPTVVPWPDGAGVELAELTECTEISRDQIGSLLDEATQLTFFTDGDQTFQLLARPAYPGRTC